MKRSERCSDCEEILRGDSPNPESAQEWYESGHHVCGKDKPKPPATEPGELRCDEYEYRCAACHEPPPDGVEVGDDEECGRLIHGTAASTCGGHYRLCDKAPTEALVCDSCKKPPPGRCDPYSHALYYVGDNCCWAGTAGPCPGHYRRVEKTEPVKLTPEAVRECIARSGKDSAELDARLRQTFTAPDGIVLTTGTASERGSTSSIAPPCVCAETGARNCPEHSEPVVFVRCDLCGHRQPGAHWDGSSCCQCVGSPGTFRVEKTEPAPTLEQEIRSALNRHSAENGSNTPDFILARYLLGCLSAWNMATNRREEWYGRPVQPPLNEGVMRAACDACGQESSNPGAVGEKCMLNTCAGTYRAAVPR